MRHSLSLTLMAIAEGAQRAIGRTMGRAPETAFPRITLLWNWLVRAARRFDRILSTPYVPLRPRPQAAHPTPLAAPAPPPTLPTWHWLRHVLDACEINAAPCQFEQFLRDPHVHALVAQDPRAARLLRGLCRRYAIRRAPDFPAILFPSRTRRKPKLGQPATPPRLRDPRPIIERTAVCPDTGRRTFVPWTAELAEYRRAYRQRK